MAGLSITHARVATLAGAQASPGEGPLAILEDAAVCCADGRIAYVGPTASAPKADREIDAGGRLLTPGLIDPHTHALFAGDRSHEHAERLAGASYLEIAARGGGIASTVAATRRAPDNALVANAQQRLARMSRAGVTTVEVKSGYGLSVEHELRLLSLARAIGASAQCEVVPTLLGLHAIPKEIDRAAWVARVVRELTPEAVRLGLARGCDAFLEQGAFTAAEVRQALQAGIGASLTGHLHADQLSDGGGAELAAELGCASADHLERTSAAGRAAMAKGGTVAVLLPLAAMFLRDRAAQAGPFLADGVMVALGSNLNPGTQRMESVSLLLAAGCLLAGLTPAQALFACTAAAARALRLDDRGRIAPGLRADLVLFDATSAEHLAYHTGVEHARLVVRAGEVVHDLSDQRFACA